MLALLLVASMSACTDNSLTPPPVTSGMLGGTVAGLQGSGLVLGNSDGSTLSVNPGSTTFTFPTALAVGTAYSVSVKSQPGNPAQTCKVAHGSGTLQSSIVSDVAVSCSATSAPRYRISGTVSGVSGTGLILASANGGAVAVTGNGHFQLPQSLADGSDYAVTVVAAPGSPAQGCSVSNGSGTIAAASVTSVSVRCASATEELILADLQGQSAAYYIDPATGTPTPSPASTGLSGAGPAPGSDPTGRFVFATSAGAVSAYTVNSATGALVAVMGSPFAAAGATESALTDPGGRFLYVGGSTGASAFTIDPASGSLSALGGSPYAGLAGGTHPGAVSCPCLATGQFLYYAPPQDATTTAMAHYSIDTATGALGVPMASGPVASGGLFSAADPAGRLFFLLAGGVVHSYLITPTTGALTGNLTTQPPTPAVQFDHGIAVDPSGKYAYVLGEPGGLIYSFAIDPASGALTALATVATGAQPKQIRFDLTGRYLFVTSTGPAAIWSYAFDAASGALTPVGAGMTVTTVAPNGAFFASLQ
jgi:hypothetical protein